MSDVMNSIFGRPRNENPDAGGYAYGAVEPAVPEAPAPETAEAESAPEAESAAETAEAPETSDEDVTGTDEEAVTEDTDDAEVSEVSEDDTDPNAVEDADSPVAEPIAETAPVVAEAAPVTETAPVVETATPAARPAAGSRGSTTIADGVVGKIVVRIAAQTEGVHSVAEDGITVELADEVAWITIPVVIGFGHPVKALGEQIRTAVIEAVEQYLGLDVEVVDVHVTDIHFPEAD
ncbi:Asp23/Gls24 family envelope stress response protein [Amycolatopsis sp. A133]|uniref:Asp23/Gls24 family envelope stress response protein n=1 Tax=Amycolatopsis sp. A133 TaxID=3064472 RepID=UPI0027F969C0|nr:Asp23/Gls24 family envelope stress response protein [Amycolatopsis sp. A133]MDQ7804477.1 Asp23/Gls24 family envelope stress response protein [Amycolatopsis sp. A133]